MYLLILPAFMVIEIILFIIDTMKDQKETNKTLQQYVGVVTSKKELAERMLSINTIKKEFFIRQHKRSRYLLYVLVPQGLIQIIFLLIGG